MTHHSEKIRTKEEDELNNYTIEKLLSFNPNVNNNLKNKNKNNKNNSKEQAISLKTIKTEIDTFREEEKSTQKSICKFYRIFRKIIREEIITAVARGGFSRNEF